MRMKPGRRATVFLALGNAVSNGGVCIYFGFFVMYLKQHGYSEGWIGLVMMLCALANMVTQPLIGYLTDTFLPNKQMLIILASASIPIGFFLPASISIPTVAAVSIILLSVVEQIYGPLFDVWTVRLNERHGGVDYGVTRGFGSIGYALAAMIAGKAFSAVGIQWMFVLHAAVMALLIVVVALTENVECDNKKGKIEAQKPVSMKQALLMLARNKKYVLFFFSYLFIGIGMKFVGLFYPVLVAAKGGGEAHLGLGLSIMSLSEFPFMFLYSRYSRRFHVEKLMMFSLSMYVVRDAAMLFAPNLLVLELVQVTQGLSFGIFLPAFLFYMNYITPRRITTTAITVVGSAGGAMASVAGTFLGGLMVERLGIYPSMICCTLLAVIGFVLFLISMRIKPEAQAENPAVTRS